MANLTDKQIIRPFIKKSSGYIKSLLSSQHVEMNDGKTLQTTVDDINNNLTNLVEEAISGGWHFRKWSSGTLEVWSHTGQAYAYTASNSYGGWYYSNDSFWETPNIIKFTALENIQMTVDKGYSSGLWFPVIRYALVNATTGKVEISFNMVNSDNITTSLIPRVYIIGRWK